MDRNPEKHGKIQVFFHMPSLWCSRFSDKKTVWTSQNGEIPENRKGPLTFVGGGMKRG